MLWYLKNKFYEWRHSEKRVLPRPTRGRVFMKQDEVKALGGAKVAKAVVEGRLTDIKVTRAKDGSVQLYSVDKSGTLTLKEK